MTPKEMTEEKPYKNTGLFADYFLDEILPNEKVWKAALASSEAKELHDAVNRLFEKKKENLPKFNEAQTEDEFIRPMLDLLGFSYIVQTPAKALGRSLTPDYALFSDEESKKSGYSQVKQNNYSSVLAIADAKYWERPLDKQLKDTRDTLTNQNPTFQISSYLTGTRAKWAILTNGRIWRLYSREHSQTLGEYYQIDLLDILTSKNLDDFLYFYLFFSRQAFEVPVEESFLDQIVQQSIAYGAKLQENLKSLIFEKLFKYLAQGFVDWRKQNGIKQENQESLRDIFDNTLILLYRLLFILYAESRDLLPVREKDRYFTKSLAKLKQEIKQDIETRKTLSRVSTDYWDDLANLFHIIDQGDAALNVPRYNGGLFSKNHVFLEKNKIADLFLTEAIYDLTTYFEQTKNSWVFVDYKTLGVKQLGSIYEGLLEFHLSIADEDLAVVKEKGREKYVPAGNIGKSQKDTGIRVRPGELYLENTKAERKATGSYYTPEYIVSYIVENTVGPLIDNLERQFLEKIEELKKNPKYKGQTSKWKNIELKNYDPVAKALELRICDPAMGSGHFLVTTVDFIANRIYRLLSKYSGQEYFHSNEYENIYESPLFQQIQEIRQHILDEMERQQVTIDKEKLEDDKAIIRRMVMKRCIFGIDLNYLAVELAKVSLWLDSFTVGAPLSFLDHHLRCGNSPIGSTLDDLSTELKKSVITGHMAGLLGATHAMIQIGELTDSTINELEKSRTGYLEAIKKLEPYKDTLDLYTSDDFGNVGAKELLKTGVIDIDDFAASVKKLSDHNRKIVDEAEILSCSRVFFHWELEFPEVFYGPMVKKENPGFDAVIGNPPWGSELDKCEKQYLRRLNTDTKIPNSYIYFIKSALNLLRERGRHSFVIPDSILVKEYPLSREYLVKKCRIEQITFIGNTGINKRLRPFPDVNHDITILVVTKTSDNSNQQVIVRFVKGIVCKIDNVPAYSLIPQRYFDDAELDYRLNLLLNEQNLKFRVRINKESLFLRDICEAHEGIHTGNIREKLFIRDEKASETKSSRYRKLIIGTSHGDIVGRYHLFWNGAYVNYDPSIINKNNGEYASLREERIFLEPKLFIVRTGNEFFAVHDDQQFYASNNLFCMLKRDLGQYDLRYIQALLNGKFLQRYLRLYIAPRFGALYTETKIKHLDILPIRSVNFTTAKGERENLLIDMREEYKSGQIGRLLVSVEEFLPQDKEGNFVTAKEKADIVHDFLAFLAEQMIGLNNQIHEEITGFLKYLMHIIGTEIDSLSKKTMVEEYHRHPFEELLAILEKNKNKLRGFNHTARSDLERLEKEFDKSIKKLVPLKAKIKATDNLIDQIVYRLYGLTDDEIRLVEDYNIS